MARRTQRMRTGFFVATLVVIGATVWASQSVQQEPPHPTAMPRTADRQDGPTEQRADWDGELILARGNQVVALTSAGHERALYEVPKPFTLVKLGSIVNGRVPLFLQSSTGVGQTDQLILTTGLVQAGTPSDTSLTAEQPLTGDHATVTFSNAERDFGSRVELVRSDSRTGLYRSPQPLSALAWRADGEVLAVGAQSMVALLALAGGDTAEVVLDGAVRALSWRQSGLTILTTAGAFSLSAGSPQPERLSLDGTQSADLIAVSDRAYVWLTGTGATKRLIYQSLGEASRSLGEASSIAGISL